SSIRATSGARPVASSARAIGMVKPTDISEVEAKLHFGLLGHHIPMIRGIEGEPDLDVLDVLQFSYGCFNLSGQEIRRRTPHGRERHQDENLVVLLDPNLINEAQIVDVDRQLGVIYRLQRGDYLLLEIMLVH